MVIYLLLDSGSGEIRTHYFRLHNTVLYPLSYQATIASIYLLNF